jgi:hypothetical protein
MKTITPYLTLLLIFIISIGAGCRKKRDSPCEGINKLTGKFLLKELVGDTAFTADTIFRDNYIRRNYLERVVENQIYYY